MGVEVRMMPNLTLTSLLCSLIKKTIQGDFSRLLAGSRWRFTVASEQITSKQLETIDFVEFNVKNVVFSSLESAQNNQN